MALQSSGSMNASDINRELGLTTNAQISIGGAVPRALAGVASGVIRQAADYYGKSNRPKITYTGSPAISSVGSDTLLIFTGTGSVTFPKAVAGVRLLVLAGGAGGDFRYGSGGGGGGGGGIYNLTGLTMAASTTYSISVGRGGSGSGPDLTSASGASSTFSGGSYNYSTTGGTPSGYSQGYDYGRGGSPGGANGGVIQNGAGSNGTTSDITGSNYVYGSGGGAGGGSGGAGGTGAGNGGSSYQYGGNGTNYGAGAGGGGYYTGGTYYYGGQGAAGVVIIRGQFIT
jgi:hypothetical protein